MKANIDKLIVEAGKARPTPDYDKEVLAPLYAAQAKAEADRIEQESAYQAEAERQRQLEAISVVQAPQAPVTQAPVLTGSHTDWMAAAGIDPSNWGYVEYIVSRESGWNPSAINPNGGACGLGQQLPCGKWAGAWNDPIAALRAMQGYVDARYGGWYGGYLYWVGHGNY